MKTTVYLTLKKNGSVRATKNMPALARDEIAIGVRLEAPDSAFESPVVFADLTVPDHAVVVPEVVVEVVEP